MSKCDRIVIFREEEPKLSSAIFHHIENLKELFCNNPTRKVFLNEENESITVNIGRCWKCYTCYKYKNNK